MKNVKRRTIRDMSTSEMMVHYGFKEVTILNAYEVKFVTTDGTTKVISSENMPKPLVYLTMRKEFNKFSVKV